MRKKDKTGSSDRVFMQQSTPGSAGPDNRHTCAPSMLREILGHEQDLFYMSPGALSLYHHPVPRGFFIRQSILAIFSDNSTSIQSLVSIKKHKPDISKPGLKVT